MAQDDPNTQALSETANFAVYSAEEMDGEVTYHIELDKVTLHFFREEFEELLQLLRAVKL